MRHFMIFGHSHTCKSQSGMFILAELKVRFAWEKVNHHCYYVILFEIL